MRVKTTDPPEQMGTRTLHRTGCCISKRIFPPPASAESEKIGMENLKIRVVTNSIVIAEELRKKDNISVILLGGEMDDKGNCYGAFAIEMIKRLHFDKCFITSAFISPKFGLSIQRSQAISFWNALIDSSKESIGLYPTEKIGFESVVSICPANRLHKLITDWDASEEDLSAFDEQGIEVIITEKE